MVHSRRRPLYRPAINQIHGGWFVVDAGVEDGASLFVSRVVWGEDSAIE